MQRNSKQGATLVGAIFIALILALSGATYLTVVRNSGQAEQNAQLETQGLYAAESGLIVATRYLGQEGLTLEDQWPIPKNERILVNGLWVEAEAVMDTNYVSGPLMKILHARAFKSQTGTDSIKRVSWRIREVNGFEYGYFANDVGSNGNKEFCGQLFYGDTYLTAKQAKKLNLICSGPRTECNKFYGTLAIVAEDVNEKKCALDETNILNGLDPLYKKLSSTIEVPPSFTDLPTNLRAKPDGATVKHLAGNVTLTFKDDGTVSDGINTYTTTPGLILIAGGTVNVSGVVKGNVTVVSGLEQKINITSNLIYADLDTNHGTPPTAIDKNSDNFLGLVTDGGIVFHNSPKSLQVSAAIVTWNKDTKKPAELEMIENGKTAQRVTLTGSVLLGQTEKDYSPFTFVQDRRLLTEQPIGFPIGKTAADLFKFEISGWEEKSL